ncbi:MAG: NERD domain-containing protein [Solirubrobacterales bacterium]|nr:NERD domain-containing protein [Solirubrobacterales bacterium]
MARWRLGADGERATARPIRPLLRCGWTLINDTPTAWGNIDHVLIGPPGVFLLESKNLNGLVSIERGVLSVRWREDPDDGYERP